MRDLSKAEQHIAIELVERFVGLMRNRGPIKRTDDIHYDNALGLLESVGRIEPQPCASCGHTRVYGT